MGNCLAARPEVRSSKSTSEGRKNLRGKKSLALPSLTVPAYSTKTTSKSLPSPRSEADILSSPHLKSFSFNDLKNATRNFRPDSLLGEGGFGCVYKGWIDEQTLGAAKPGSGAVVAVKKLKPEGFQGHKEWLSEVNYLGQLHHPNLVRLIGYCLDGNNRLLVYEYLSKGSLENHLFRRSARPLPWAIRVKVAIGAARGLAFLHESEQQVIYRDFKASNILLDSEFNAKLSDFGLAKAGPTGDRTHVSTQVMGTQGYAAPEYIATGRLTTKCDVYSFGVVLLELLSGRRVVDREKVGLEQNLVDWTKPYLGDKRKLYRIMDSKMEGQYPRRGAYMASVLALECISESKTRPPMSTVLEALEQLPTTKCSVNSPQVQHTVSSPIAKSPLRSSMQAMNSPIANSPSRSSRQAMNSPIAKSSLQSTMMPDGSPLPSHQIKSPIRSSCTTPRGSPAPSSSYSYSYEMSFHGR